MPIVAFNICCQRDCVSRHNGGTAGAPLKPLRDDSALTDSSTPSTDPVRGGRGVRVCMGAPEPAARQVRQPGTGTMIRYVNICF